MIEFQHPGYLLALSAIPLMAVLFYLVLRWKKMVVKKIGDESLVRDLMKAYSPKKFYLKFILIVIAFSVAVIALANSRKPEGDVKQTFTGSDVMIALDVSNSMLAEDIQPDRLDRAKDFISRLIDQLPNDKIGLVVFAGRAYLQMPLTVDHDAAKMYLSSVSTNSVPTQGTVIADALKMCYAAFNPKEKIYKSVILITDGEDHDDDAIKTTKALAANGVMVNTVGIGSPQGAVIPDPVTHDYKKDADGNIVVTKLNEDELKSIASNGNGIYQLFSNTDDVIAKLVTQLNSIGGKSFTAKSSINYESFFQWFLIVALLLLLIEMLLSEKRKLPKQALAIAKKIAPVLILSFFISTSFGQSENTAIQKGNSAYKKQKFDEAAASYQKAVSKNPSNYNAFYNLGDALYKSGKLDNAVNAYDSAISKSDSLNKEAAYYNKGVVLQNNKKLPECIEAYKNALRLNQDDQDARLNLQKALQQQKQQQQKQSKDNNKQQNKQDQQKPQQQPSQQNKDSQQQQQPQQQQMSREDAEQKLQALAQQEQELQDKLKKATAATPEKPAKDW